MPIVAGELNQLSSRVFRITAPNPGIMTGPGTNTYLIRMNPKQTLVIDPGPAIDSHIDAIQRAVERIGGSLQWILCTHSHLDHSPAAPCVKQRCGGIIVGQQPRETANQDTSFAPDQTWRHQQVLNTENTSLTTIHTPGHASNHLCFYLAEEQLLFTGDHIMEGSTVVISPPDGNMAEYIESLRYLTRLQLTRLAPAHGNLIEDPQQAIQKLIKHRLQRESKVLRVLKEITPATLEQLTARVYDDVPEILLPVAQHSLTAHLEKLRVEGKVNLNGVLWTLVN